jgi:hypothetical protein
MANQANGNQFRDDEIVVLTENREGKLVKSIHPKIGGRLRLAHEDKDQHSITTKISKYEGDFAVVKAATSTNKESFPGIGIASLVGDHTITPLFDQASQPLRKIDPGQCSVVARKVDRPIRFADKQACARRFLACHAFEEVEGLGMI